MRMNILHQANDITILDDAYNANPQSMRAAVEVLAQTKGEYKIAILGDMFELGPLAPVLHRGVGEYLGKKEVDCLLPSAKWQRRSTQPHWRRGSPSHSISRAKRPHSLFWKHWLAHVAPFWSRPREGWLLKSSSKS